MYRILFDPDEERVATKLALWMGDVCEEVIKEKGVAKLGLAGGRSPERTYEVFKGLFSLWERLLIFPTDERFVPSESDLSNYRLLRETLPGKAKIYRVKTELPLEEACMDFNTALSKAGRLDLILLGLGEDGHTASLFPGIPCEPCGENACVSKSEDGLTRISMSLSFINRAERVAFLVLGERKRKALDLLLKGADIPASKVRKGEILLFTDLPQGARSLSQNRRSRR